jgi:lycopene beta-cyclase
MNRPISIAIVGGGLAGLSLAVALVRQRLSARITIIDPRTTYEDDRTWCFWDVLDHPFREAVSHRWQRWRITTEAGEVVASSQRYDYCRLPAAAFYERAMGLLEPADNVLVALGNNVTSLTSEGSTVLIGTDAGPMTADIAFDARPPTAAEWPAGKHPFLWQGFEGWRVRTQERLWDPATVDLMNFSQWRDEASIGFLYTLPLAPTEALVESTMFAPPGHPAAEHAGHIERALAAHVGTASYTVAARETGRIPMTTAPPPASDSARIVPIGTRAGAPRPSSGYAFLPIQRHAQRLAAQLAADQYPDAPLRGRTTKWLDGVFLRQLQRQPHNAPALFQRLFERVPAERLVRFLTETGSLRDHLAVMASLPLSDFAGEAIIGPWRTLPQGERS